MKDCLLQPDMMAFVDQNAPADQLAAWRRHLRTCDHCATQVARLRGGMEPAVREVEDGDIHASTSVGRQLFSGLEPNLQLGDFLLERRLGAGGMGVVYQARQVSLNRQVALKIRLFGIICG